METDNPAKYEIPNLLFIPNLLLKYEIKFLCGLSSHSGPSLVEIRMVLHLCATLFNNEK